MVGSKTRDGIVKVGDILAVPKNMIPKADYTALGHIHTPQNLGDNIFYSGAITKLTVGQKDLGVTVFETENGKIISQENIKLQNVAKYEKVTASSIEDAEEKLRAIRILSDKYSPGMEAMREKEIAGSFNRMHVIELTIDFETPNRLAISIHDIPCSLNLFISFSILAHTKLEKIKHNSNCSHR